MKKVILCFIVGFLFFVPSVFAKEKVQVYMFKGDGCPHCEDALKFFEGLKDSEKSKFTLHEFEVWKNEANKALMQKVTKALGEDVSSVPYIIVGEKTFRGYDEEIGEDILEEIDAMYASGNMVDVVGPIVFPKSNPIVIGIFVCLIGAVVAFTILSRKKNA